MKTSIMNRFSIPLLAVGAIVALSVMLVGAISTDRGTPPVGSSVGDTISHRGLQVTLRNLNVDEPHTEVELLIEGRTADHLLLPVSDPKLTLEGGSSIQLTQSDSGIMVSDRRAGTFRSIKPVPQGQGVDIVDLGAYVSYGHDSIRTEFALEKVTALDTSKGSFELTLAEIEDDQFTFRLTPLDDNSSRSPLLGGSTGITLTTLDSTSKYASGAIIWDLDGDAAAVRDQFLTFSGPPPSEGDRLTLSFSDLGEIIGPFRFNLGG